MRKRLPLLLSGTLLAIAGCSAADRPAETANAPAAVPAPATAPASTPAPAPTPAPQATAVEAQAGWYMEHGAAGTFQPCGQQTPLAVDSAELRQRAREFELEPDTPVYVRLSGTSDGPTLSVTRIDQFGSPEPVRDCSMTGTVTQ